jgi:hypothetical protein
MLEQRRFINSAQFDEHDGKTYLSQLDTSVPWPENRRYIGEPGKEVDANWDDLIGDRYFSISEQEAIYAWGDMRREYVDERQGGYTAGYSRSFLFISYYI